MNQTGHEAVLWEPAENNAVQCRLCNFRCRIAEGKLGHCAVRRNQDGRLYTLNYDHVCAVHVDPIEKKPLFHYQPGQRSFSIAAGGCNFQCDFCQNWQISQMPRREHRFSGEAALPGQVVAAARRAGCRSIAYTYTEPTIFMELAADCGRLARAEGIGNVFVSNGYLTPEAIDFAAEWLDAINVDLKAFTEEFYRSACRASLAPVLATLRRLVHHTDIWVEVTTLVVPGGNDSESELRQIAEFIGGELGPHVPWHISRYRPDYERTEGGATPPETLQRAYELGKEAGLRYVYVGNLPGAGHESTFCHHCGRRVIERVGYHLGQYDVLNGACMDCGTPLAGKDLNPVFK